MESWKSDVHAVTDLVASKFIFAEERISVLKIHKLLYYVEAWHVTFFDKMLFDEDFRAWVHGPVCYEVFTRFRYTYNKSMYSEVLKEDLKMDIIAKIPNYDNTNAHVENVLEAYGKFSGAQLEQLSHQEDPWRKARGDLPFDHPSDAIITKESMREFYSSFPR